MTRYLIAILAALSMLGALSVDAYLPALPAIARQFSVSPAAAQQSLTIYVLAFGIMTLFYGTLSDSFGRRPVVLVSLVLYFLSSVGAAFAHSMETLLVFRLLQGLTAGAGAVIGRAIVGDLCAGAEAHKAMSYISAVFGLAPAIAPILGGWLQAAFGWRSIFLSIAIFTLLLLAACATGLRESLPPKKRPPFRLRVVLANYRMVGSNPRFMLRSLSMALAFSGIMIYVAAAPNFVLEVLGLSVTDFGWLFVPLIGGMTLGSLAAGRLSTRWRSEAIIRLAFFAMFVAAVANLAAGFWKEPTVWSTVPPIVLYAFGASAAAPAMMMMALEMFPEVRGLGASFQTFVFMLMFTLASGLIAPLIAGSALKFALVPALGCGLSMACWLVSAPKPEKRSIRQGP